MDYTNHLKEIQRNKKKEATNTTKSFFQAKNRKREPFIKTTRVTRTPPQKSLSRNSFDFFYNLLCIGCNSFFFFFLSFLVFQISQIVECQINISPFIPFLFRINDAKISNKVAISPGSTISIPNQSHTYSTSTSQHPSLRKVIYSWNTI